MTTFQEVYSSSAFPGPVSISGITFFDAVEAASITPGTYAFNLALTSKMPGSLDLTSPANNIGGSSQAFFTGPLGGSVAGQFTVLGTPYIYDPGKGNLILTIGLSGLSADAGGFLDQGMSSAVTSRVYFPNGGGGGVQGAGLVTGFVVGVPEPAYGLPVLVLLLGLLVPARNRGTRKA